MVRILDIGCGHNKHKGDPGDTVIGLDKTGVTGVDVVWDLEITPLPFEDKEFDRVVANDVLEHVQNIIPLLEDVYRILKVGGLFDVRCPFYTNSFSLTSLDHKHFFGWDSLNFNFPNPFKMKFSIEKRRLVFLPYPKGIFQKSANYFFSGIFNRVPELYQKTLAFLLPCGEIEYQLRKRE